MSHDFLLQNKKITIKQSVLQSLIQIIAILLVIVVLRIDVMLLNNHINEYSLTEFAQQTLLFLVVCCFAYIAKTYRQLRHFHVLVTGFFGCMLIREFDAFFDELIKHGFWVYPAVLVALVSIGYAWLGGQSTTVGLSVFVNHKHFYSLTTALVIILVFSRLFGMGDLWEALVTDNSKRAIKNLAEEGAELLGYALLSYNSLMYMLNIKASKPEVVD